MDLRASGALTVIALGCALASPAFAQDAASQRPRPSRQVRPTLISPGDQSNEGHVATGCPTFSWTLVAEARAYEVRAYELAASEATPAENAETKLRKALPEGATSWTPGLEHCLPAGRYAWAVAAVFGEGERRWSHPALFRVTTSEPPPRVREAPPRSDDVSLGRASLPAVPPSSLFGASSLRNLSDEAYVPPVCGTAKFSDVPAGSAFCSWIEQLDRDGIMTSCDGVNFCPDNPVTRQQLAMALGKTARGTTTWHPAEGSNWLAPPVGNASTTVDDAGDVGQWNAITIGVDGLPIISYYDNTTEALKVAHCQDVTCAGPKTTTIVDNSGNLGGFTSIAIGSDGLPVISYYDATVDFESGIDRQALKVAHCNDVACTGQDETISYVDDPAGAVGYYTSIAIGPDGAPIISYTTAAGSLRVAHCNDVACAGADELITTLDASGVNPDYTSITIGADTQPIISYKKGAALWVAYCGDWYCTSAQKTQLFDFAPQVFTMSTPITIDSAGLPLIAIRYPTGGFLALVHCSDLACSGGNETLNLVATLVRANSSLTIGADGMPFITLDNSGSLRIVHCNDPICQGNDEVVNPMFTSGVGDWNAVTIGVDGLPIMSYYDSSLGALRVIHCASVFCTPYFRRR